MLVYLSFTARWCSFNLCPSVLVSYVGLWESITWDLIYYSLGTGSLGCTRTCCRVVVGWKNVLMPNGAMILLMDSEVFFTYGIVT